MNRKGEGTTGTLVLAVTHVVRSAAGDRRPTTLTSTHDWAAVRAVVGGLVGTHTQTASENAASAVDGRFCGILVGSVENVCEEGFGGCGERAEHGGDGIQGKLYEKWN